MLLIKLIEMNLLRQYNLRVSELRYDVWASSDILHTLNGKTLYVWTLTIEGTVVADNDTCKSGCFEHSWTTSMIWTRNGQVVFIKQNISNIHICYIQYPLHDYQT